MNLKDILSNRLHKRDIDLLCTMLDNEAGKEALFCLIGCDDERVGYNALWLFTHFNASGRRWLWSRRDSLIDVLLATTHIGKRRLLLTLLEAMPFNDGVFRCDFFDYCIGRINSSEPYAIRALCMKLAYKQCCSHHELKVELEGELDILANEDLPPGLKCARKNIIRKLKPVDDMKAKTR